ncbi:2-dehydro-3-deoxygalactonokinase [Nitrospirillum sp. BR 11828]|uniref:2-dehydro-3-deoxygalactonokinase n=1 Tax=Nitrospirillum sp. BR 11828 TaxID=3104325 RepID=UPI002ACA7AC0|nr:2-dehydro-3-deoxygalactonokinase [Nitrospirillum sp. BR 11828]MDZ5650637.1 2-dehydro-3-deoxygalactonokinase [Nitrospirillum sp. BR 11828]
MSRPVFIAGDWGTSNLRLSLVDADGAVLDTRTGPGAAAVPAGGFPDTVRGLLADWDAAYGRLPLLLCGMVGSTLGWVEVPYAAAPAGAAEIADHLHEIDLDGRAVYIAPGVKGTNLQGAPDVMRGEETQVLGALITHPDLATGNHLLCLPGTHSKWVDLRDGRITGFTTAMSGEIYALLSKHSTLARGAADWDGTPDAGFRLGLARVAEAGADVLHLLFETRARQMAGVLSAKDALGFLSGLVIGGDVAATLARHRALGRPAPARAVLVGAPALNTLYTLALASHGVAALALNGAEQSTAGLLAYFRRL